MIQLHHIDIADNEVICSCKAGRTCGSAGKHPINTSWQKAEPLSAPDIQALWDSRPEANVGIATGSESGIWVLDIDPDKGGLQTMSTLVREHGPLPRTYCVKTGSGGAHYYFTMEPGLRNSADRIGKGVDVRADGGQVVAPPSRSDKGPYTVLRDADVVPAPEWLLELARKPENTTPVVTAEELPKPDDISPVEWERLRVYTEGAVKANMQRLQALKDNGWDGEPWDQTTFEIACAMIELANSPWNGLPLEGARRLVLQHAPRDETFDSSVIQTKWDSALARVGDKARAIPADKRAEMDPLFGGPDVRPPNPTEGGGARPNPVVGEFFGEKGAPDYEAMRDGILALGPIGWGRDRDFWVYRDGVWVSDRDVVERRCTQILGGKYRNSHTANVSTMVKHSATQLTGDPLSQWMNFRNGMLDWQTGELLGHDANFKSTIQFPINYDPNATCPTFEKFLSDVMHEDYVALAWEMLGYLLYSGNKMQVAFLFYGSGQNGKGTLIRVIEEMLGRDNVANESLDQLNKSTFSPVNLYGKIANIAGDIDSTYQEQTANFKKLTGEDMIGAERKFGDRFNFQNWAVPLFSANKFPGSSDVTEGYLRRWVVLHFHKHISDAEKRTGLSDLLSLEVEGIAAKAVIALRTLMQRGRFDPQGEALKGKAEFSEAIDQVRQWVASGEVMKAPDHWEPVPALFAEYTLWATRTNRGRVNETEFSHRLEAAGYRAQIVGGMMHHVGLKPRDRSQPRVTPSEFFSDK